MNVPRTPYEVETEIYHQLQFLGHSAARYDAGYFPEAKRIANAICILLVDRKNSKSLTSQRRDPIAGMFSTRRTRFGDDQSLLVGIGVEKWVAFEACNATPKCIVSSGDWLDEDVWVHEEKSISRKELLLSIRDRHGGAHFDPNWKFGPHTDFLSGVSDVKYAHTVEGVVFRVPSKEGGYANFNVVKRAPPAGAMPPDVTSPFSLVGNLDFATVRQMANEVLESFVLLNGYGKLSFLLSDLPHRKVFVKSITSAEGAEASDG